MNNTNFKSLQERIFITIIIFLSFSSYHVYGQDSLKNYKSYYYANSDRNNSFSEDIKLFEDSTFKYYFVHNGRFRIDKGKYSIKGDTLLLKYPNDFGTLIIRNDSIYKYKDNELKRILTTSMLQSKQIGNFNTLFNISTYKSINFAVRGLKRKRALQGCNSSAIDPSRYTVTLWGLVNSSPFLVTGYAIWLRKPITDK